MELEKELLRAEIEGSLGSAMKVIKKAKSNLGKAPHSSPREHQLLHF